MHGLHIKKTCTRFPLGQVFCCLICVLSPFFSHTIEPQQSTDEQQSTEPYLNGSSIETNQEEDLRIKMQPRGSLSEKVSKESVNPQIIEIFDSTLFNSESEYLKSPSFMWLHNPEIKRGRSQIIGSQNSIFEVWWKMDLDGILQQDRIDATAVVRTRVYGKVFTRFTSSFFAKAEFELATSSGSIQRIYERTGETNGIGQREVYFLWKATRWLNVQFGVINQSFLKAPLLLSNIPLPSVVESIDLFSGKHNDLSLSFQQAVPVSFSDAHSIHTQSLVKMPLLITKSLFWNHNPKTSYIVRFCGTFYHFNKLPADIAATSLLYGNSVVDVPRKFKHGYTGFYFGLEGEGQLFPNVGLKTKLHYINNIAIERNGINADEYADLSQGVLYSLQLPIDITKNIRITPIFEWFVNQPDASVGYYNSERYGRSDRTGYLGEIVVNFYNRNMELGFRHMRSRAVRTSSLKDRQMFFLLFLRTNYAKI